MRSCISDALLRVIVARDSVSPPPYRRLSVNLTCVCVWLAGWSVSLSLSPLTPCSLFLSSNLSTAHYSYDDLIDPAPTHSWFSASLPMLQFVVSCVLVAHVHCVILWKHAPVDCGSLCRRTVTLSDLTDSSALCYCEDQSFTFVTIYGHFCTCFGLSAW